MFDDLRNHDPRPSDEEMAWMAAGTMEVLVRSVAGVLLAVSVGIAATFVDDRRSVAAPVIAQAEAR
jgi:hypothetical protein